MIIVEIEENAGIGNQMFQYAHGAALARKYHHKLLIISYIGRADDVRQFFLDKLQLDRNLIIGIIRVDCFNFLKHISWFPKKNMLNRAIRKLIHGTINLCVQVGILEECKTRKYDNRIYIPEKPLNKRKNYYISGFYESWRYFNEIRDNLCREFVLKNVPLDKCIQRYLRKIEKTNSVAVHIRRGDFNICGRLFSLEYYDKAIEYIESVLDNPVFIILCEDKKIYTHYINMKKSNIECIITKVPDRDLVEWYLLSKCHHHIVTNSTYSWWSAYVANYEEKRVFIPQKEYYLERENSDIYLPSEERFSDEHYNDYFPEDWIVVPMCKEDRV